MHDETMPHLTMNQATWDRALRISLGLAMFALGISGLVSDDVGGFLRVASLVPIAIGAMGVCPLYALFGFRTCREDEAS
jgi:hypothetical protein